MDQDTPMQHGSMHQSLHGPKMIVKILGILALTAIVLVAILRDRIVNYPQWQVTVVGQGKVSYVPDTATITLGVQIDKAPTAQIALKQLNQKIDLIIAAIKTTGTLAEDIQTQNYSLYPQYDYRDNISVLAGYTANQQLTVKVHNVTTDSQAVSKVIDEASKAGVNQVNGISFEVSNINDLRQQARLKALADARSKANELASAAGVHLGKIIGWAENISDAGGPVPYFDSVGKGGGGGVAAQTPPGTQELIIEMGVNYRIK